MTASAPTAQMHAYRLEKSTDNAPVDDLEKARFLLTAHEPHHCARYLLALQRVSAVM